MLFQDANQVIEWWCFRLPPEPQKVFTTGYDYWLRWIPALITEGEE